jgi:hypothetical protein
VRAVDAGGAGESVQSGIGGKMRWTVLVSGDSNDLEELSKVCLNPDLRIMKKDEEYLIESSSFDDCLNSTDVKRKADEIIEYLNATKRITLFSSRPLARKAIIAEK